MSENSPKSEPPSSPECGAAWVRSGHRFAIDGALSHKPPADAADEYYENPEKYDDTTVVKFECGKVIESSELR